MDNHYISIFGLTGAALIAALWIISWYVPKENSFVEQSLMHASQIEGNEKVTMICGTQSGAATLAYEQSQGSFVTDLEQYGCALLPVPWWGKYELIAPVDGTRFSVYKVIFPSTEEVITIR